MELYSDKPPLPPHLNLQGAYCYEPVKEGGFLLEKLLLYVESWSEYSTHPLGTDAEAASVLWVHVL